MEEEIQDSGRFRSRAVRLRSLRLIDVDVSANEVLWVVEGIDWDEPAAGWP